MTAFRKAVGDLHVFDGVGVLAYTIRPSTGQVFDTFEGAMTVVPIAATYDNTRDEVVTVSSNVGKKIECWSVTDNTVRTPVTEPTMYPAGVAVNSVRDVVMFHGSSSPYLIEYDLETLTTTGKTLSPTVPGAIISGTVKYSPDGSLISFMRSNVVYVHEMATGTQVFTLSPGSYANPSWHPTEAKFIVNGTTAPYVRIYDTTTWLEIDTSAIAWPLNRGASWSDDGTLLAIRKSSLADPLALHDGITYAPIQVPPAIAGGYISTLIISPDKSNIYYDNNNIVGLSLNPVTLEYESPRKIDLVNSTTRVAIILQAGAKWEFNGTINETVAETQWLCSAYEYETGVLLNTVTTSGTTFKIPLISSDAISVDVRPVPFGTWVKDTSVSLNDKVYPTDPVATPYYYKATTAGITSVSEPVWPTTTAGTVTDGSVVWEQVERIIKPVTHAPLIPTVAA